MRVSPGTSHLNYEGVRGRQGRRNHFGQKEKSGPKGRGAYVLEVLAGDQGVQSKH